MTFQCKKCERYYKILDEDTDLCFICYKDKFGKWSKTFSDEGRKKGK
jgi:RNA polymerase subunit RPABC4/transcription elongation factor Spt4